MVKTLSVFICLIILTGPGYSQNSMVGDGFGGRLWYSSTNYTVGSYSAYSTCYNTDPNQLYAWGDNGYGQLGLANTGGEDVPTPIPDMTDVKYFSTGYIMGAIKNDNTGWAWGLGIGLPVQVITDAYFLDASSSTISYVKNDGTVWSIGDNGVGNFGDGTTISNYTTSVQMLNIANAVRVSNNHSATIILLDDGTLMAVGFGYLGLGPNVDQTLTPLPITGIPPIVEIQSNEMGTIALTGSGDVYFWGVDNNGYFDVPTLLPNLKDIVAISGCDDGYHFMALDENENCFAWGDNWGQMGFSAATNTDDPQIVATDVIDIMAGETFSYIVKSDGSLWAAGGSNGGSIWLDLPDMWRETYTKLDPSQLPGACELVGENVPIDTTEAIIDTVEANIIIPNVFSPNGDGENEEFYFPNEGVTEIEWEIYNRWGQRIFETNQLNESWTGRTFSGSKAPEGTYFYILHYKLLDTDWETAKGYLTLVR